MGNLYTDYCAGNGKTLMLAFIFMLGAVCGHTQGEFVVRINPVTGEITKTGPAINGVEYIYADDRALNENSGTFFFPSDQPTKSIFQIKLADGSTISSPQSNMLSSYQFDNATGKLYGLDKDAVSDTKFLVEINPITGVSTPSGPTKLESTATYSGGFSTFDETNHRFIFLAPPNILYTLDAADGSVIFSPDLMPGMNRSIVSFAYANKSETLYAMVKDNNDEKFYLSTIDPETGTGTIIGDGFLDAAGNGSAAIDEDGGRYYYLYYDDTAAKYFIASVSLTTGEFLNKAVLPKDDSDDNFFSLKFNRSDQKLYSIHWDAVIVSGVSDVHSTDKRVLIAPNPMTDRSTFYFEKPLDNAGIVIQNPVGQHVKTITSFTGQTLEMFRDGLPGGEYFFQIFEKGELLYSGYFIVN